MIYNETGIDISLTAAHHHKFHHQNKKKQQQIVCWYVYLCALLATAKPALGRNQLSCFADFLS